MLDILLCVAGLESNIKSRKGGQILDEGQTTVWKQILFHMSPLKELDGQD